MFYFLYLAAVSAVAEWIFKMSDNNDPEEVQEEEVTPDYTKYDEDSVPPPEKEIKHVHPGRPDLDYEDTPVGPAPEE
ncbi:hypothetical protein TELCIR_05297 [Teladorsagia circumcincta]|uniref:Uncharacterized protein n=1 Tax=Teladorsagia circumcincta TaxID=45464 RepID=A0A2G9URB0_TELCI|nr:hypothetical protein TELCIR_05297 [Teladorsagia circumcincta]